MRNLLLLLVLVAALPAGWWLWGAFESTPPEIDTRTTQAYVGSAYEHAVDFVDRGRGVESVRAWVEAGEVEPVELIATDYPGGILKGAESKISRHIDLRIPAAELDLPQGSAKLIIEVTDYSWRRNVARVEVPLVIDTRKARVGLRTGLTYVRQGGAEMVVYQIDEQPLEHGVRVGDVFFPGFLHPTDPDRYVALYAVPYDAEPDLRPVLEVKDRAENLTSVPLAVRIQERKATTDRINLSRSFMERKVSELLGGDAASDPLEAYLRINRGMRKENADTIRGVCASSSEDRIWSGAFLQLPNSKVGAGFAEARTYLYEGNEVDHQLHQGFDLASTARAQIPAANDGVVVFADDLGIYGKAVIVDHGLSLFSLYGHLSELAVERGQAVSRGQPLGRTGATGLAGGDHLHFAMLLGGTFIDPLEWFDERWIQEHLEAKLAVPEEIDPEDGADGPLGNPSGT